MEKVIFTDVTVFVNEMHEFLQLPHFGKNLTPVDYWNSKYNLENSIEQKYFEMVNDTQRIGFIKWFFRNIFHPDHVLVYCHPETLAKQKDFHKYKNRMLLIADCLVLLNKLCNDYGIDFRKLCSENNIPFHYLPFQLTGNKIVKQPLKKNGKIPVYEYLIPLFANGELFKGFEGSRLKQKEFIENLIQKHKLPLTYNQIKNYFSASINGEKKDREKNLYSEYFMEKLYEQYKKKSFEINDEKVKNRLADLGFDL